MCGFYCWEYTGRNCRRFLMAKRENRTKVTLKKRNIELELALKQFQSKAYHERVKESNKVYKRKREKEVVRREIDEGRE
jgi:hypothetical protein